MLIPGECGHWGSCLFHLSDCPTTTKSKISDIYSFAANPVVNYFVFMGRGKPK